MVHNVHRFWFMMPSDRPQYWKLRGLIALTHIKWWSGCKRKYVVFKDNYSRYSCLYMANRDYNSARSEYQNYFTAKITLALFYFPRKVRPSPVRSSVLYFPYKKHKLVSKFPHFLSDSEQLSWTEKLRNDNILKKNNM